ncbi:hypothetical protein BT69DRAFT_1320883 [Atractiella rhizophila]|nr:hypothetical protein BT69DRAFT_1320883 [Atractiella rhizophila]
MVQPNGVNGANGANGRSIGQTNGDDLQVAPSIPKHEVKYHEVLQKFVGSKLHILNSQPDSLSTSPSEAVGKILQRSSTFTRLQKLARDYLSSPVANSALRTAVSNWLDSPDANTAAEVRKCLDTVGTDPAEQELAVLEEFLEPQSFWIIGSDAWARDVGFSALHHILSSGVNVKLLIIDSTPFPVKGDNAGKKNAGLYAMNYGNAFVASIAVYGDYSQTCRAIQEAEEFNGPSVLLAYLPGGDDDSTTAVDIMNSTRAAIDQGYWPLYRWNPANEGTYREVFRLDSEKIKAELQEFLDRDNHLTLLSSRVPNLGSIASSSGSNLRAAQQLKVEEALDKLRGTFDGPPLLILYASDGGQAEKVAKRLNERARRRGVGSRISILDQFAIEDLALETNVAFVVSTAGQGEFPQNGRKTWKKLGSLSDNALLSKVHYSVFGMGDSHYWPRKEDAHYYNKPGKDLDRKLSELGAQVLTPIGLGNDQDPDGPQTGYKLWEPLLFKALGVESDGIVEVEPEPITNEHIKIASNYLRGTIAEGLVDTSTGALAESDGQLTKFHGIYQQDDRDIREQRAADGVEPAYSFMVRVRMPGGVCQPQQWLAIDQIAEEKGNQTFKLTTRQTFQFHGIIKSKLKPAIQDINRSLLDTIAACGDVNRNVMCAVDPSIGELHRQVYNFAKSLSEHLLPHTTAYAEIWLDKKKVAGDAVQDFEPLYGPYYLPRKFKMAVAIPPNNEVDIYANDVGFIAIIDQITNTLSGFNVTVGGGMGVTHGNKKTYPRLADVIGFITPEQGCEVAEKIMTTQRDNGNRTDRKNARLKYTIDRMGLGAFKAEVENRLGWKFQDPKPFTFTSNVDNFGWRESGDGKTCSFVAFIENGRVKDEEGKPFRTGLREIAKVHKGVFRLTPNQHLIIADIPVSERPIIEALLQKYHLDNVDFSGLRLSSSACVAFPTLRSRHGRMLLKSCDDGQGFKFAVAYNSMHST